MDDLIKILQASFAPCVLISGLGLLLLTTTNRLGRSIDRIRLLCQDLKRSSGEDKQVLQEQVAVLYKRCRFLQFSIALLTMSIFFASVIIFALFSAYILGVRPELPVKFSFMASLVSLIIALFLFMLDIRLTLHSVKMEIKRVGEVEK